MTRLEELHLTGNQFKTLPMDIGECESLEVLDLSCCELESLPEQFCYMTRLMELNLGNNQLKALPQTIGRMSRLVVLNLSDNQLDDLPLTMGYCQGLGKLGAGINLSRNPIKSEQMLAKWNVGTDHLVQFLEMRLDAVGKPPVHDVPRSEINGPRADKSNAGYKGLASGGGGGGGGAAAAAPKAEATAAEQIQQTLSEKLKTLVAWGDAAVQDEFKPAFTSMKFEVTQLSDVSEAIAYGKFLRNLKEDMEKARAMIPNLSAPPPPTAGKEKEIKNGS